MARTTDAARGGSVGRAGARRSGSSTTRRAVVSNADRRAATRKTVLEAAATCFDRRGYLATTLDEVLASTKLTKGAVYFHFGSKEALASAVIEEQATYWPDVIADIMARPGSDVDHLVNLTYEIARTLRDNEMVRAGMRLSLDADVPGVQPAETLNGWIDTFSDLLRKARRSGSLAGSVSPAAAARVIVAGVLGAYHLTSVVDRTADARRRLDEMWALLLPSLSG